MKLKKSLIAVFFAFLMILAPFTVNADEEDLSKHISYYNEVTTILAGDPETGKILLAKNANISLPVASMSKLMTYYVVKSEIQAGNISLTDVVTVSKAAASKNIPEYSSYGMVAGEKLTVEQLLNGMMVVSGNDASISLAEHVSGSEEAFVKKMNETALELGLTESHFVNSHGLTEDGESNEMSAENLFTLSVAILNKFPEVVEYSKITEINEPSRKFVEASTIYEQFSDIPGILGLKTGTTDEAGFCFTALYDMSKYNPESDFKIAAIIMGAETSEQRWRTVKELGEFMGGSFIKHKIVDAQTPIMRYEMPSAKEGSVVLYPEENYSTISYSQKVVDVKYNIEKRIKAPTEAESVFGSIYISQDGKPLKKINIISHDKTTEASLLQKLQGAFEYFTNFLFSL